MTDTPIPDAAVQALRELAIDAAKLPSDRGEALDRHDLVRAELGAARRDAEDLRPAATRAWEMATELDAVRAELDALRAVADAARGVLAQLDYYKRRETSPRRLAAALDALPTRDATQAGAEGDGCGELHYRQHSDTGMVQRVHADGTHHMPSFDPRCTSGAEGDGGEA